MKNRQTQYLYQIFFCILAFILCLFFIHEFVDDNNKSIKTISNSAKIDSIKGNNEASKGNSLDKISVKNKKNTDTTNRIDNNTANNTKTDTSNSKKEDKNSSNSSNGDEISEKKSQVSFIAVGDDLVHIEVYKSGKKKDGTLNYDHLFSGIKSDIKAADLAVINQETIFGSKDMGFTGYPNFCSPKEVGEAIVKAGFDIVLQATNHTMDRGLKAVDYTLDFWDKKKEITLLGVNRTQKERDSIRVVEKNGIKFALLNYTFSLNGHDLPEGKPYLVNLLLEDKVKADIKKAKKKADVVIVFPHWGLEYNYKPSSEQEHYTKIFADLGVDLVIGTHPHVLQPVKWVKGKNGNKMLIYYSLGNYISYQREAPRMLGGMAKILFEKDESGVKIKNASIVPIVTHYENLSDYNFKTYKLSEYTDELAKKHGILKLEKESVFTLANMKKIANDVLGEWYKD